MIQLSRSNSTTTNNFYLNLFDKMTNIDYSPLISLTNQLTGKSKVFRPLSVDTTNKDRYIKLSFQILTSSGSEDLTGGKAFLGSKDYPLGFYDVVIYKNTSNENMDISGLSIIYNGLANVTGNTDDTAPVKYSEYTTNDSDTESVYITF